MLSRSHEIHLDQDPDGPELDEGWWASVLAEEEINFSGAGEEVHNIDEQNSSDFNWQRIQETHERDEIVELNVRGFNRGGLLVQHDQVQGFVPISHLIDIPGNLSENSRQKILTKYVGKSLKLKIIECEPEYDRVVLSERAALAGVGSRKELFSSIQSGDIVEGTVTNITGFGVFVDLGGVEGLIHVSELSWGRVEHPKNVLCIGQCIKTLVLQINEENSRVALSFKRLNPNPWTILDEKYQIGDTVCAKITSIMRFGAFAKLQEGIEGLIHISSIRNYSKGCSVEELLQPCMEVEVEILHIDSSRRRLGLGLNKIG
ncbi:MAG: S1 RNA-binding domain-containing protein [Anaerolineaceae bacterium]|nr:S1 RNA-binding domain-containing protein [Anaerolineaceae bacterium]